VSAAGDGLGPMIEHKLIPGSLVRLDERCVVCPFAR
jgi:hypothetical protein